MRLLAAGPALRGIVNVAMREVFASSGFTMAERLEGGDIEVELSLVPTDCSVRESTRFALTLV